MINFPFEQYLILLRDCGFYLALGFVFYWMVTRSARKQKKIILSDFKDHVFIKVYRFSVSKISSLKFLLAGITVVCLLTLASAILIDHHQFLNNANLVKAEVAAVNKVRVGRSGGGYRLYYDTTYRFLFQGKEHKPSIRLEFSSTPGQAAQILWSSERPSYILIPTVDGVWGKPVQIALAATGLLFYFLLSFLKHLKGRTLAKNGILKKVKVLKSTMSHQHRRGRVEPIRYCHIVFETPMHINGKPLLGYVALKCKSDTNPENIQIYTHQMNLGEVAVDTNIHKTLLTSSISVKAA